MGTKFKSGLFIAGILASSLLNAQQGKLEILNFSNYDFEGRIAGQDVNDCKMVVLSVERVVIEANSTAPYPFIVGGYDIGPNYYYPVTEWYVETSAGGQVLPYNDSQLENGVGFISTNTNWAFSHFSMYDPITNMPITDFGGNIGDASIQCPNSNYQQIISTPNGYAEWFTIGSNSYLYIY